MASRGYLDQYLAPLAPWLEDPTISEIAINPGGALFIEREGMEHLLAVDAPEGLDAERLGRQLAGAKAHMVSKDSPIVSTHVEWRGAEIRAQAVFAPAVEDGAALSFRKYRPDQRTVADFPFLFGENRPAATRLAERLNAIRETIERGDAAQALRLAVEQRLNVLISGGTSTAKTTLARAMIALMAPAERLITIEDARELHPAQSNCVELVAERDEASARSATRLLQSALRMRPDRIVVGELRGGEAFTFLEAINTGHGGSMTTIHAEHPGLAIERLAMMVTRAGVAMPYGDVVRYVRASIHLIIQLERAEGRRGIAEMFMPGEEARHGA